MSWSEEVSDPYLRAAIEFGEREIPGFEIRFKRESKLMWLIDRYVRLFNPTFMTHYHTTFGSTMYLVHRESLKQGKRLVDTIMHEATHMHDRRKAGFWKYTVGYAMPQVLAIFALPLIAFPAFLIAMMPNRTTAWLSLVLGFLTSCVLWAWLCSPWMLLDLIPLLALAPWPSQWRTKWERRGYQMSVATEFWMDGKVISRTPTSIAPRFTGMDYFRMCPDEQWVKLILRLDQQDVESGKVLLDPWFRKAHDAIKSVSAE